MLASEGKAFEGLFASNLYMYCSVEEVAQLSFGAAGIVSRPVAAPC